MASIPNNGYAAVMAGTNVYTGSNFYGSDCPKTPIVPTDPDDLCNKLYVDTIAGGGTVVAVSAGTNISVTGTIPNPIVNLQNPLTAELNVGTQSLRDTTGAVGTSGQVLTAGTGGQVLWGSGGGGGTLTGIGAGLNIGIDNTVPAVPVVRLLAPLTSALDVGTQDIISSTSTIDITPLAGQDCNVAVSGAGGLHVQQSTAGGQVNPEIRLTNSNATGSVAMEVYKNKPTASVGGDVLHNLSVYGKDGANNKQEYTRITHTVRDNTSGGEDGSMEMSCFVNGAVNTFLQLNGIENEVNCLKNLDMTGRNIVTNTANLAITTASSTGTGSLDLISKANTTITSSGAFNATSGSSGINLTANSGGTIQTNTTGATSISANTQLTLTSTTGIINITNEAHYGKVTTVYPDQVYQSTYQPILTATINTFPVSEIQREGQQVIFINSAGNGANELTPISTPNFTITAIIYRTSINQTIVGGFNHIQGRCEIRCGSGINDVVTPIGSGFFTYIAFPVNATYFINTLYSSTLTSNSVAVGGFFTASTTDSYDGGANFFPSSVANFLCIDVATSTIAPKSMADGFVGNYGVDGEVITIAEQDNAFYTPATTAVYILGGKFQNIIGGSAFPTGRTAVFCDAGVITPPGTKWITFISANNTVNKIFVYDDRVVFGGLFSNIGGVGNSYLAFHDATLPFPQTSLINGFTPPSGINSGFELNPNTCYVGCLVDTLPAPVEYPVYQFDLTNMAVTPSIPTNIPANTLIAPATGWLTETGATLDFIVGHDAGTNNYCYKVQTPDFVELNGATYLQNCFLDTTTSPTPAFFHQASLASTVPTNYYLYVPTTGAVSITTTLAFPFVSAIAPANNWKTITLATRNNFATGTVVQFGTNDQRIVILASNGATFSN